MVSCVQLADEVKEEVANHETENSTDDWCCINGSQVAEVKVVCWYDQDRDRSVVSNRPRD